MKTKQVPALVMLTAGFITCVISIAQHMEVGRFLKVLLLVLICFYILGCIAQVVLEKNFGEMKETEEEAAEGDGEETQEGEESGNTGDMENIESDGEES